MLSAPDGTAYRIEGPADAPPVVLVHGLGLSLECWDWTAPALTQDFRVLRYDLYGHGASPPPPEPASLTLFSRQLAALMEHLNIDAAALVGFSLGGMIVRRAAEDMPRRVRALAILHSPHRRTIEQQEAILARVAQAGTDGPGATVEAALERWFTDGFRAHNPELMDRVRGWVTANDKTVYQGIYRVLADGIDEIVAPDPAIACPALVMTGDEDFGNGPEMTRAIAAEIPGSDIHILPGLRHMALAEAPEAVNGPLRDFLIHALRGETR